MRRLAFIDVLRGIAILTVVVHHLPEATFGLVFGRLQQFGGRGVDLFFVLSGFLIGSTCLNRSERGASPWVQAKAYWLLRTLRIWPLYYPLLALFFFHVPHLNPQAGDVLHQVPWPYVFFYCNDIGQPSLELGVLWSLAIEEQFYLLIGLLVWVSAKRREVLEAAFSAAALAAILVSLRFRTDLLHLRGADLAEPGFIFRLYFATLSRVDQLGFGLLAAVVAPYFNRLRVATSTHLAGLASWAAVALALAVILYLPQNPRLEFTVVGVLFASIVVWLQRPAVRAQEVGGPGAWVLRVVGNAGTLSFGFYLLHPVARTWITTLFTRLGRGTGRLDAALFLGALVAGSWTLAALSHRFFEAPILRWAHAKASEWVTAGSAANLTVEPAGVAEAPGSASS